VETPHYYLVEQLRHLMLFRSTVETLDVYLDEQWRHLIII